MIADHRAVAPPGVAAATFAAAALADTYEVLADLAGVTAAIAGPADEVEALLWPGSLLVPPGRAGSRLATGLADADEALLVPADAPDLPGLVVAKAFQALVRADLAIAPELGGSGAVCLAVRLPLVPWLATDDWDLDAPPTRPPDVPRRSVAIVPGWRRLRTPGATDHLDPGLEGWDQTRALLAGRPLGPKV